MKRVEVYLSHGDDDRRLGISRRAQEEMAACFARA